MIHCNLVMVGSYHANLIHILLSSDNRRSLALWDIFGLVNGRFDHSSECEGKEGGSRCPFQPTTPPSTHPHPTPLPSTHTSPPNLVLSSLPSRPLSAIKTLTHHGARCSYISPLLHAHQHLDTPTWRGVGFSGCRACY